MEGRKRKRKKSKRTCLRCDRKFLSEGIYNRVCPNCRESNDRVANTYLEPLEVWLGGIHNRTRGGNN